MPDNVILKAENLELKLKERNLKIVYNFEICGGDFVIVKGRNGSGKSTLFKAICKSGAHYFEKHGSLIFNDPANGFNNADIVNLEDDSSEASCLRRSLAYIGQEDKFVSWSSARGAVFDSCWNAIANNKDYSREEKRQKRKVINALIDEFFSKYLTDMFTYRSDEGANKADNAPAKKIKKAADPYVLFGRKKVTDLSGGQQKLLHVLSGVVKAKVCGCKLVILDEPLNNLDGENKYIINEMFKDIIKNGDITVLVITHCQIFESINKVLTIETGDGVNTCSIKPLENYVCHRDCLNEYNK